MLTFVDGVNEHAVLDAPTVLSFLVAQFPAGGVLAIEERPKAGIGGVGGERE